MIHVGFGHGYIQLGMELISGRKHHLIIRKATALLTRHEIDALRLPSFGADVVALGGRVYFVEHSQKKLSIDTFILMTISILMHNLFQLH
mgnify:CR=1 FL=1